MSGLDSVQHFSDEVAEYDRIKDEYLSSLGLRVLRFTNTDVLTNIEGMIESIVDYIEKIPRLKSPLVPLLQRGRQT